MSIHQLGLKTSELDLPRLRPTLDLDFVNSKVLDQRITFTRSSGGSYINENGIIKYSGINEPRFNHDIESGKRLGLLVEESRTNLNPHSRDFTQLLPGRADVTSNSEISPDGLQNSNKITCLSNPFPRIVISSIPLQIKTYTASVFAKAGSTSFLHGTFERTSINVVRFFVNLITGESIITTQLGTITASIRVEKYPNQYFRISVTANVPLEGNYDIFWGPSSELGLVTAEENSYIYLWGAQLEEGGVPTSYIPTQGSAVTRSADVATITGKNFNSFYNQNESTLLISGVTEGNFGVNKVLGGIANNLIGFVSSVYLTINTGLNISWGSLSGYPNVYSSKSLTKGAISYSSIESSARYCIDNGPIFSINNRTFTFQGATQQGFPKNMNILSIGLDPWLLGNHINGEISRITYWPNKLNDSQLKAITK